MRSKSHFEYFLIIISILVAGTSARAVSPGDILSYFYPGVDQVYGLEAREASGITQIHGVVGSGANIGQVYMFDVTTASSVKDGSMTAYDNRTQMMKTGVSAYSTCGLAILPTYEGAYGTRYLSNMNTWQGRGWTLGSLWTEATPPGSLDWSILAAPIQPGAGYWNEYDYTAAYRTYATNQELAVWTIWSSGAEAGLTPPTTYGIYYYPWVYQWGPGSSGPTKVLTMPKALYGVTLGQTEGMNGDLYALCQDGEVLHVSAATGAILDRFFVNIPNALGIAYDSTENCLWISSFSTNNIYQVAVAAGATEPEGAGRVLSSFSTDLTEVWGLDIEDAAVFGTDGSYMACDIDKSLYVDAKDLNVLAQAWLSSSDTTLPNAIVPGQTLLHLVGAFGEINRYDIKTASKVKDGSESAYDSKFRMTSPTVYTYLRGLTVLHDYAGPYGRSYVATLNTGAVLRSVWGDGWYGEPNNLNLATINGGIDDGTQYEPDDWYEQKNNGDICVDRRTWSEAHSDLYLWHTYSNSNADWPHVGAGAENTIYKYLYTTWLISSDAYDVKIDMDKPLRAVSIGDESDLWVLCQDGEVLHIADAPNASGGPTILDRFYISPQVNMPWGFAYDPSEKTLWIANQANNKVYQISTGVTSPEEFLPGDLNKDRITNFKDFGVLALQWMSCTDPTNTECDPSQGIAFP